MKDPINKEMLVVVKINLDIIIKRVDLKATNKIIPIDLVNAQIDPHIPNSPRTLLVEKYKKMLNTIKIDSNNNANDNNYNIHTDKFKEYCQSSFDEFQLTIVKIMN